VRLTLAEAVLEQLAAPEYQVHDDRPLWMRYSDLDSAANPFVDAVRSFSYAAKIMKFSSSDLATAALVVSTSGRAWLATVEPDDDGQDGMLIARPAPTPREWIASILTGSPSHSVAVPRHPTLSP
jgi:hypothetical protein